MNGSYATAGAAYRELRSAIGPWARAQGYRRWPGTQAGWHRPGGNAEHLWFKFESQSMVNPDIGNSHHGLVQLEPAGARGSAILRQSAFSCCLVQAELDQLARIQGTINRRRPRLPGYLRKDATADSMLGHYLRSLYDPAPEFRLGQIVSLEYHGLDDARELAAFVAGVLPRALERFLEGHVAQPVDTTPAHLRPDWLSTLD